MAMNKLLVLAILLLALASCGGSSDNSHKYPSKVKDNFMKSCGATSGGSDSANKVCQCSFDAIQKKYTLKEFNDLEQNITGGGTPTGLIDIVTKCSQQN